MINRITVCKDCKPPVRHIGCHGTCEAYIKERNALEEIRKAARRDSDLHGEFVTMKRQLAKKSKHNRRD